MSYTDADNGDTALRNNDNVLSKVNTIAQTFNEEYLQSDISICSLTKYSDDHLKLGMNELSTSGDFNSECGREKNGAEIRLSKVLSCFSHSPLAQTENN